MASLELAGAKLQLLPQRAVHWPAERTLFVSDLHLGKDAALRDGGLAVPPGSVEADLARLGGLIDACQARRVLVLGDLFHSARGLEQGAVAQLAAWAEQRPALELLLIRGNHDNKAGDPPAETRFRCVDEPFDVGSLALCHRPLPRLERPFLCGHLHPGFALHAAGGDKLRSPCFALLEGGLVLPSFGSLTGCHELKRHVPRRVWMVGPEQLFELPARALAASR